ncbi:MAG: HIT family protein [Candidatus Wildermuthbacteria bacterium]|nr:HIT family protein [Candidatus Wildermuthbacteria bacterium]
MPEIVCWQNTLRYYGARPEVLEKYRQIEQSGKCPFCPDGVKEGGFEVVGETRSWTLVVNQFPYKGSVVHLLMLPKRHIVASSEITIPEWDQWPMVLGIAKDKYPALKDGFGLGMREGVLGGVTLHHLHFHIIMPKSNSEGGAEIQVNFGIG